MSQHDRRVALITWRWIRQAKVWRGGAGVEPPNLFSSAFGAPAERDATGGHPPHPHTHEAMARGVTGLVWCMGSSIGCLHSSPVHKWASVASGGSRSIRACEGTGVALSGANHLRFVHGVANALARVYNEGLRLQTRDGSAATPEAGRHQCTVTQI